MLFEDTRDEKEVEKQVKEEKDSKDEQASLRDGFASFEAESSLDEFEDPQMNISEDYNE